MKQELSMIKYGGLMLFAYAWSLATALEERLKEELRRGKVQSEKSVCRSRFGSAVAGKLAHPVIIYEWN